MKIVDYDSAANQIQVGPDGKKRIQISSGTFVEVHESPGFDKQTGSYITPTSKQHLDPSAGGQMGVDMSQPLRFVDGDVLMMGGSSKQANEAYAPVPAQTTSTFEAAKVVETEIYAKPPAKAAEAQLSLVRPPTVQVKFFTGGIGLPIVCHKAIIARGMSLVLVWNLNFPDVPVPEFTPTPKGAFYEAMADDGITRMRLLYINQDFVVDHYRIIVFPILPDMSQQAEEGIDDRDTGEVTIGGGELPPLSH